MDRSESFTSHCTLQATSLPRERVKEFQSEAQRHQPTRYPHPQTSAASSYGSVPPPAPSTGTANYQRGQQSSIASSRDPHLEHMNSGVKNMSIGEGNGYRAGGPPIDTRTIDQTTGQLIRSNSFH